jgi:hypothetical protein
MADLLAEALRPLVRGVGQSAADALLGGAAKAAARPAAAAPAPAPTPVLLPQLAAVMPPTPTPTPAAVAAAPEVYASADTPPLLRWVSAHRYELMAVAALVGVGWLLWRYLDPDAQVARALATDRRRDRTDRLRAEIARPVVPPRRKRIRAFAPEYA